MRKVKPRKFENTIVVIVDGDTEKWYIQKVKEHYKNGCLKKMAIKPELPQNKKVDELFELAKEKVGDGYSKTILILDMDNILKDKNEYNKFTTYYQQYLGVKNNLHVSRSKKYEWMKNMLLILNTPCLEFWFLTHFHHTNKFYPDYDSLKSDLKAITELSDYDKSEEYFKKHPDIYLRLNSEAGIQIARNNAQKFSFSLETAQNQSVSEMNLLFDLIDAI